MMIVRTRRLQTAILTVAVVLIVTGVAASRSDAMQIVRSIDAPGSSPFGLDYIEVSPGIGVIFHTDNQSGDVYRITTGGDPTLLFNVGDSIGLPYATYTAQGICFVGDPDNWEFGVLYILEADRGGAPYYTYVRAFSPDGTHLDTWDVSDIVDRAKGITHDGDHFWLIGNASIVKCDASFNLVQSYPIPWGGGNGGFDFDPITHRLYNADVLNQYVITFARGSSTSEYEWYSGVYNVPALAIGHLYRGTRYLWLMDNSQVQGRIVEVMDQFYDPVESTSWGAIKALFR